MAVFPRLESDTKRIENFKMETFLTVQIKIPSIIIFEWATFSPIGLNDGLYIQTKIESFSFELNSRRECALFMVHRMQPSIMTNY